MKNKRILRLLLLCTFLTFFANSRAGSFYQKLFPSYRFLFSERALSSMLYETMALAQYGLSFPALDYAVQGYQKLVEEGLAPNTQYLTVVDFSQPSWSRRFYLLDLLNRELVLQTFVMHGRNSGGEYAEHFSNRLNSNESSLGFFTTGSTYVGKRGYSLRLEGQEPGINSNALARGIVVHGSNYINEDRALNRRVERSLGCPALPQADNSRVINLIKDGSVMFIYHPNESYLAQTTFVDETAPFLAGAGTEGAGQTE